MNRYLMPSVLKQGALVRPPWYLGLGVGFIALLFAPVIVPPYYTYLLSIIYVHALLATSLNLCLGYGGLLQLHQAVFYGVGAYTVAILSTRFSLPVWLSGLLGPLVAALLAFMIGWFCIRLRGLYFGMLTIALGQLVWAVVYRWYEFTGGDNGIHGLPVSGWLGSLIGSYYLSLLVSAACLGVMYAIISSPFGLMLQATRDNPVRSEGIGIDIRRHRLIVFVISGFFAGVAGVLFAMVERSVTPELLFHTKSAEIMIMCLLGGMSTFFGPTLGAVGIVVLSTIIGIHTEYWLLVLGIILLFLVLFLPQGILGYLRERIKAVSGARGAENNRATG